MTTETKENRRIRRARARESEKHFAVLGEFLMDFYGFLERTEKPSDEEVREEFVRKEKAWKQYCGKHQLTEQAKSLFNNEVSQSWKNRYTTPE